MKKLVLLFCILSLSLLARGQDKPIKLDLSEFVLAEEDFKEIESQSNFPGGVEAMYEFIDERILYPIFHHWSEYKLNGDVVAEFVVDEQGKIRDVELIQSLNPLVDTIFLHIIAAMPDWNPKINEDGAPYSYKYKLTVNLDYTKLKDRNKILFADMHSMAAAPMFSGGENLKYQFISKNIKSSEGLDKVDCSGRTLVQFVIDRRGKILYPHILRSIHPACDAEVLRVIRAMPDCIPAKDIEGNAVNATYIMLIIFPSSKDANGN